MSVRARWPAAIAWSYAPMPEKWRDSRSETSPVAAVKCLPQAICLSMLTCPGTCVAPLPPLVGASPCRVVGDGGWPASSKPHWRLRSLAPWCACTLMVASPCSPGPWKWALQAAARDLRLQLLELAAEQLQAHIAQQPLRDGGVEGSSGRLSYAEIIADHFGLPGGELIGRGGYRGERG